MDECNAVLRIAYINQNDVILNPFSYFVWSMGDLEKVASFLKYDADRKIFIQTGKVYLEGAVENLTYYTSK